ncbi:hypothetical protein SPRG_09369 [Saprolegnia parasitica CBS 223.65]|uniref:PPM-type phosphatase domain-containing protein n=1 Tax=Saprolegnia parasitica (strain CBS 223.65) TaxID=695850 RepID=A0A067CF29_SAPPC|nr:hypothetical protein SPRG_09369 [Saprolegnia parasitica CBS 223.65]KDO25427.1 hypothetical protein SPRG_09369 [Saprolegnia parasitica CBS 223.65]|eukprot:XP_012203854.1 hypothetical protein SPRG_09369 [Saprolegnia parasitica CBS 223.65]
MVAAALSAVHADATTDVGNTRRENEDEFCVVLDLPLRTPHDNACRRSLFAVFDGHGGVRAATFLKTHLVSYLVQDPQYGQSTSDALASTLRRLDAAFLELARRHGGAIDGSTAIVVVLEQYHGNASPTLICANLGDSRAVLISRHHWELLSRDQTASRVDQQPLVYDNGGFVAFRNTYRPPTSELPLWRRWCREIYDAWQARIVGRPLRVYPGGVVCTQVIGDLDCKQVGVVRAIAECTVVELHPAHTMVVLASDGLWAVVANKLVHAHVRDLTSATTASHELVQLAKAHRRSTDNITVVVATLTWQSAVP